MHRPRLLTTVDLDLTDEISLLAEDSADNDPQASRARLAALNLRNPAQAIDADPVVFDVAIYKATGDRHLASLFGRAA
jgi:hypothetical protein